MSLGHEQKLFLKRLGLRVRELRYARGWSQEELASQCGLHRTYVGAVERGERNISVLNLLRISSSLGVSVNELFPSGDGKG
ncbi:MAG: helix-turn-helix transcriptional regulator [Chloroflexia bacterium]